MHNPQIDESPEAVLLLRACNLLRKSVVADFVYFAELTSANDLLLRAGRGWTDDPSGRLPPLATAQARAALSTGKPLAVHDYRTDERFREYGDIDRHGILSGFVAPVTGAGHTFGLLAAYSRTAGHFRREAGDIIETLAILLSEVLQVYGFAREVAVERRAFAAAITHDLNNVFMGVQPFIDVIRRAPSKQRIDQALDYIAEAIRRGQRIAQDIVRFAESAEPVRMRVELPLGGVAPRRVLLVDDDPIVASGLQELLKCEGFEVTLAGTGRAAIRAVIEGPALDAVILDVGLPDMDGTAVFEEIAAAHPDLPVIFSTGHADLARLDALLSNRRVGYLIKPYERDTLMNALSAATSRP